MRIYFTRHGESQANRLHEIANRGLKHGLTREGRAQASALANRLIGKSISRIYSSPLLRAIETSVILANRLDVEYEVVDALREYDCGIAEGRSDGEAWRLWQDQFDAVVVHHQWEQRIEGGESFLDIRARFVPFVEDLVDRYKDTHEEFVCVSHGGLYWLMLPQVLQGIDYEAIQKMSFRYAGCITTEWRSGGLQCLDWDGADLVQLD